MMEYNREYFNEKLHRKCAPEASSRPYIILVNSPEQPIHVRNSFVNKIFCKDDFVRESPFIFPNIFRNILYSEIYHMVNFMFQFKVILELFKNLYLLIYARHIMT